MKEFYTIGANFFQSNLNRGESYENLQKTIIILIADFELKELKNLDYFSSWKIIEENYRKTILTEKFQLYIIELPKINNLLTVDGELLDWLFFLVNPNSERVIEKMKNNEALKLASEKLDTLSHDERMSRLAELREKAIISERTNLNASYKEGIEHGTEQTREKIATKLLKENMSVEFIHKTTRLSISDIEKLKKNLN